jgi:hypothetical protein
MLVSRSGGLGLQNCYVLQAGSKLDRWCVVRDFRYVMLPRNDLGIGGLIFIAFLLGSSWMYVPSVDDNVLVHLVRSCFGI